MGVIHKLKPEIRNWILEKKRATPLLSCRGLISLVEGEFKIKVSKSSVNFFIKEAGLSMPVGRRQKKRRKTSTAVQPQLELTMETRLQLPAPTVAHPTEAPPEVLEAPIEIPTPTQPEAPIETPPQAQPEPTIETPHETQPELPKETPALPQPEVPVETPPQAQPEVPIATPIQIPTEILPQMFSSGIALLKAADYLLGGTYYIQETIKKRLSLRDKNLLDKIEYLIYAPLLGISEDLFKTYLNQLPGVESITQDIFRVLSGILTEMRCIKVLLSDGDVLYLDGQLHTIWSVPNIPYDFVNTIYNIKNYINKFFYKGEPFILSMAPGYDTPTTEFFNFILSLGDRANKISNLTLYGNKLEELDSVYLEQGRKYSLVFGLWPWQFVEYRRVKKIGEFKPFYFEAQEKNFYLADIEIELSGPNKNQLIALSGCALKTNLAEKTRLIILSNIPQDLAKPEYLANLYLSHWPNLEEAFQDFSRKVELFTYTANSQRLFPADNLNLPPGASYDIKQLFDRYLETLDLFVKWHFLPSGYEDKNFSIIKESFYDLKAITQVQKDHILITFQPPQESGFLKALEYACRRLNEKEITSNDGKRLWFSL